VNQFILIDDALRQRLIANRRAAIRRRSRFWPRPASARAALPRSLLPLKRWWFPSSSLVLTSKMVPRTEMTAVGVMMRFGIGLATQALDMDFDAPDERDPRDPEDCRDSSGK